MLVWDISTAFLQGMNFDQLATVTGQEVRQVSFTPPRGSEKYVKELGEARHYDPSQHVLQMLKPVYGLKDAPRAWRLRLDAELRKLGGHPMLSDAAIYLWHRDGPGGRLCAILSTHVDDLKGGGDKDCITHIRQGLEKAFGALTEKIGTFMHCGVQHEQQPDGSVLVDQLHYVSRLHAAEVAGVDQLCLERPLSEKQHADFLSLLGGVAWVTQSRMDVCIYTVALQRKAKSPKVEHLLRLNRLVKWLRRKPVRMLYAKLQQNSEEQRNIRTSVITDSAFRKETTTGLCMRGFIIGLTPLDPNTPGGPIHFIDWGAKKQKKITRSTYAAELHSLVDGYELGKIVTSAYTELCVPRIRASKLVSLEEQGLLSIAIECSIDAKSVFDSLSNAEVAQPSESNLLFVLLAIKEGMQSFSLRTLWWTDTRDMLADGLNKGVVSRAALNRASATGIWKLTHEPPIPYREPVQKIISTVNELDTD